jgi:hypothetical protein
VPCSRDRIHRLVDRIGRLWQRGASGAPQALQNRAASGFA